ncbi:MULTISPECIES: hypothetical protein [unclassified Candidatus Tisiphia]
MIGDKGYDSSAFVESLENKGLFSRSDKAPTTFLAFLNFVGALIWLR